MSKTKILFDEKRHGDKIESDAVMIGGLTMTEIKAFIDSPNHTVHDISAWIETDVNALDEKVLQSKGFMNATNNEYITFENYTLWRKNLAQSKVMIKIGSTGKVWEEIATNDQLNAFLDKFGGKDNLYSSPTDKKDEYYIKSIEEIEAMTWVQLKKYLKNYNIDAAYDLKSETKTRSLLAENILNRVYEQLAVNK